MWCRGSVGFILNCGLGLISDVVGRRWNYSSADHTVRWQYTEMFCRRGINHIILCRILLGVARFPTYVVSIICCWLAPNIRVYDLSFAVLLFSVLSWWSLPPFFTGMRNHWISQSSKHDKEPKISSVGVTCQRIIRFYCFIDKIGESVNISVSFGALTITFS